MTTKITSNVKLLNMDHNYGVVYVHQVMKRFLSSYQTVSFKRVCTHGAQSESRTASVEEPKELQEKK